MALPTTSPSALPRVRRQEKAARRARDRQHQRSADAHTVVVHVAAEVVRRGRGDWRLLLAGAVAMQPSMGRRGSSDARSLELSGIEIGDAFCLSILQVRRLRFAQRFEP